MAKPPSKEEIQRLVIDLCRASVTLRVAEERRVLSDEGASGRLAEGIEAWLSTCEVQILPILDETPTSEPPPPNILDFTQERAARRGSYSEPHAPADPDCAQAKAPGEPDWAALRARVRLISDSMRED